nr:Gag-Pol polyprotein [Tanacetum cinerariifolium]
EATKFVGDFKSLAKEADESLAKHKVSNQKDNTHDTSANTKFAKQPIVENLPNVGESHALSKPVTSNSVSTPQESIVVKNNKVIAPGMFRINPDKTSREAKNVPNSVRASNKKKTDHLERRNRTLVEAARTMLSFSHAPLFLLSKAIATTYPKNDHEDIRKLGAKGDIGFFIGYSADSCAYRVYNRWTKKIIETMNVSFDELSTMAFDQRSSKPGLNSMTSGHINSGLDLTYAPSTITTQQPSEGELDLLFEAMYDDYIGGQPSATARTVPPSQEPQVRQTSTASTTIADITPTSTNSSSLATNIPNATVDGNTFVNPFVNSSTSAAASSSSQNVDP